MVEPAYLEFRIPSGLDEEFNVYRNAAKLDFIGRKGKTNPSSLGRRPQYLSPSEAGSVFIFNKSAEASVNISRQSFVNKSGMGHSRKVGKQVNSRADSSGGKLLPNGEALLAKSGEDIVAYKLKPQPVLKAYPGKDPGNLRVTTNSRSTTSISVSEPFRG